MSLSLRLGDYRRVLLAALKTVGSPVAVVTVTAPGWIIRDPVGGLDPLDPEELAAWNRSAALRWSRLDRRVKGRLRREGLQVEPLARVAQRQHRGLDHLHLVMGLDSPMRVRATQRYVELLKQHGREYGFGFIDDPWRRRSSSRGEGHNMVIESAEIAGAYLTRYLTDRSEGSQLVQLVQSTDASWRPLWVSPRLTRRSGVTCRRCRRVRHAYWVVRAHKQGSRPRLPVWWGDIAERVRVMSLLTPRVQTAT